MFFSVLCGFTRPPGSGSLRLLPSSGHSQHESARYKSAQIYILFLKSPSYGLRFLRFRTLPRNTEHVGNTRCQHGSARFSFGRSRSATVFGSARYAENRTAGLHLLRRIPVHERQHPSPSHGSGLSVEKSVPDAEAFGTPHIPGSYRLRRHFPRYCGVITCIPHPYKLRILPKRVRDFPGHPALPAIPAAPLQARTFRTFRTSPGMEAYGRCRTLPPGIATSWLS